MARRRRPALTLGGLVQTAVTAVAQSYYRRRLIAAHKRKGLLGSNLISAITPHLQLSSPVEWVRRSWIFDNQHRHDQEGFTGRKPLGYAHKTGEGRTGC